jgi:hypothetical protein
MKKLTILLLTFLFAVTMLHGQAKETGKEKVKKPEKELKSERVALRKLEGTIVDSVSKDNFSIRFPDAKNVQSKRINTYDEFYFTDKDGNYMKAYYDSEENLVGTTQLKTITDIPANGQQEIKTAYKDYTVGHVIFYNDNQANATDMTLYGIQFDDVDSYFVELTKGSHEIVVRVLTDGLVMYFSTLK